MPKRPYLSTGQAARMLGVTPDTVLKWIKRGKLVAMRTAGGHFRVAREQLEGLLEARSTQKVTPGGRHCWEYFGADGHLRGECARCLVHTCRAARCFELVQVPKQSGFVSCFHFKGECGRCPYYVELLHAPVSLLVVTDSLALRQRLTAQGSGTRFRLEFAAHDECFAHWERLRPQLVVIDGGLSPDRVAVLCARLASSPRAEGLRIVLAQDRPGRLLDRAPGVVGEIRPSFSLADLEPFVDFAAEPGALGEGEPAER